MVTPEELSALDTCSCRLSRHHHEWRIDGHLELLAAQREVHQAWRLRGGEPLQLLRDCVIDARIAGYLPDLPAADDPEFRVIELCQMPRQLDPGLMQLEWNISRIGGEALVVRRDKADRGPLQLLLEDLPRRLRQLAVHHAERVPLE